LTGNTLQTLHYKEKQVKLSNFLTRSVWLVPGILLLQISSAAAPAPVFKSHVTAAPSTAKVGKPDAIVISLTNQGSAVPKSNVDLEVYDAKNKKIAQQDWSGQTLAKGKNSAYHWAWKPAKPGVYTFKLGVFSTDWKTLHYWVDKALVLKAS
jgi:hypothetical protein